MSFIHESTRLKVLSFEPPSTILKALRSVSVLTTLELQRASPEETGDASLPLLHPLNALVTLDAIYTAVLCDISALRDLDSQSSLELQVRCGVGLGPLVLSNPILISLPEIYWSMTDSRRRSLVSALSVMTRRDKTEIIARTERVKEEYNGHQERQQGSRTHINASSPELTGIKQVKGGERNQNIDLGEAKTVETVVNDINESADSGLIEEGHGDEITAGASGLDESFGAGFDEDVGFPAGDIDDPSRPGGSANDPKRTTRSVYAPLTGTSTATMNPTRNVFFHGIDKSAATLQPRPPEDTFSTPSPPSPTTPLIPSAPASLSLDEHANQTPQVTASETTTPRFRCVTCTKSNLICSGTKSLRDDSRQTCTNCKTSTSKRKCEYSALIDFRQSRVSAMSKIVVIMSAVIKDKEQITLSRDEAGRKCLLDAMDYGQIHRLMLPNDTATYPEFTSFSGPHATEGGETDVAREQNNAVRWSLSLAEVKRNLDILLRHVDALTPS